MYIYTHVKRQVLLILVETYSCCMPCSKNYAINNFNHSRLTINNADPWLMYIHMHIRRMLFHLLLDATTDLLRYIMQTSDCRLNKVHT